MPDNIEAKMAQDQIQLAQAFIEAAQGHLSVAQRFGEAVENPMTFIRAAQQALSNRDRTPEPDMSPEQQRQAVQARWN